MTNCSYSILLSQYDTDCSSFLIFFLMNREKFIEKFGCEPMKVTENFATKSLGTNYNIKDAFIEFGDNAYDARTEGEILNYNIEINTKTKTFTLSDNGTGISDDTNLFKLGGTDKEHCKGKIGKYGVGVAGASSAIATQCRFDKSETVEVIFASACNGRRFEKHIAMLPDGNTIIGKTFDEQCENNIHYTKITFTNVELKYQPNVIEALEETFEEPLQKDMKINFNGRQLGKTGKRTFVGDEPIETVMVGDFKVKIKYRIIGGSISSSKAQDRSFDEAGLRVYDEKTGRLLAKSAELWFWYAGRKAQPTICGLRAAIYIESSIEAYNKFGVKPAKNGITYAKYYSTDPDFKDLSSILVAIYNQASNTTLPIAEAPFIINGRSYQTVGGKLDGLYKMIATGSYVIKKKYTQLEIAKMVDEIVTLEKKVAILESDRKKRR